MNYIMQKVLKTVTRKYLRFINLCVLNNSFILKVIDFCSILYVIKTITKCLSNTVLKVEKESIVGHKKRHIMLMVKLY